MQNRQKKKVMHFILKYYRSKMLIKLTFKMLNNRIVTFYASMLILMIDFFFKKENYLNIDVHMVINYLYLASFKIYLSFIKSYNHIIESVRPEIFCIKISNYKMHSFAFKTKRIWIITGPMC